MPVIQVEPSVAAGATNSNVFSGSAFEIARGRSVASIGITAAATGSFVTVQSGADIVLEESPPVVKTIMPVIPDDFYYNDVMEAVDRLRVQIRNPTGGAIIHRAVAMLSPIA